MRQWRRRRERWKISRMRWRSIISKWKRKWMGWESCKNRRGKQWLIQMLVGIQVLKCNSLIILEGDGLTSSRDLLVHVKTAMKCKESDMTHMREVVSHVIRAIVESIYLVAFSTAQLPIVRQTIASSVKTNGWISLNNFSHNNINDKIFLIN